MSQNNAKTTIHVTNLPEDKTELWDLFEDLPGFRRVSFHQDFCFVCFDEISFATQAIDFVQDNTTMVASYAKHGLSNSNVGSITTSPNRILYMSLSPFFMEKQWSELLRIYEGFEAIKFFASYGLARFSSIDCATDALEDILERTNLSITYSKIKLASSETASVEAQNSTDLFSRPFVSLSATSFPAPKKTIHVTNMDRDRSHFFKILLQFPGFDRVAFYNDYSFVCFQDISHAVFAIDEIMNKTKMKASFAKVDFIHHAVAPSQIGTSNSILRISDFPSNMTHAELIGIFQTLEGFLNATQFYVASCLVHFKTQENGRQALERLNHATNMTAIYSIKGIKEPERPSKLGKSSSELPALYPLPVRPRPTSAPSFQPGSHRPPSSLGGEEQQQMQPSLEERNLVESGARNPGAQSSSVSLASNNSAMTDQTYKDSGLEDHHQVEHGPFQGVHYDGSTAQMPGPFSQDAPLQPLPHGIPPPVVNLSLQFEETKAFLHSLVHRVHFLEHENALLRGALMAQNQSRRSPALNPESVGDDQSVRDDPYASYHSVNDNNSSGNINKKGMLFETPSSLGPNNAPPFLGSFYPSSQQSQIPPSYRPVQHNPTHNNTNNLNTNPGLSVWGPPHMDMANASITNTKKHRLLSASNNGQQQGHPSQSMSHEGPEQEDESRPHIGMLQGLLDMCE